MTYETELANIGHATDVVSDAISAALVQRVVLLPHIFAEDLPADTNVKLFRKSGSLTADKQSESASITFSADEEITETEVTVTATKTAIATKLTYEAQRFSRMNIAGVAQEQGRAIGRDLDDNGLALFSSISANSVTASTILTADDLLEAAYKVRSGTAGQASPRLVAILHYKGVYELQKELVSSGAASFGTEMMLSLLAGMPQPNGYRGSIANVDIFETDGLPTSGGDNVQAVFDPAIALCGMYSPAPMVKLIEAGSAGGWTEVYSCVFDDVKIWNDAALCKLNSDS